MKYSPNCPRYKRIGARAIHGDVPHALQGQKAHMDAPLKIESVAHVNTVVWITSLEQDELETTWIALDQLELFFKAMNVGFQHFQPQSAAELITFLKEVERAAREDGLKPVLHFDTHGNKKDGIEIEATQEHISWKNLNDLFRAINISTGNNLCIISMACHGLNVVKEIKFDQMVPYYFLAASSEEIYEDFIECKVVEFYQDLFVNLDIVSAYENHLTSEMQSFHSERLLYKAVAGYVSQHCFGEGAKSRAQTLQLTARREGIPLKASSLRNERRLLKKSMMPDQVLLDRWSKRMMGDKKISFDMAWVKRRANIETARRKI